MSKIRAGFTKMVVLLLILLIAPAVPVSAEPAPAFQDVKTGDWFYPAVDFVTEKGLFHGTGDNKFSPNTAMTRGMFVTVLGRFEGIDPDSYEYQLKTFYDVNPLTWYGPYVAWASGEGVVGGIGDGKFGPENAVSRQDLVTMLYRYLGKPSNGTAQSAGGLEKFADYGSISGYAKPAVEWAFTNKVLNGSGNRLLPKEGATRAQVAQIFYNAYDLLRGQDGEDAEAALEKVEESSRKKLEELTREGGLVSSAAVMTEMGKLAAELETAGTIRNVSQDTEGIFFEYADGTPGGWLMELDGAEAQPASMPMSVRQSGMEGAAVMELETAGLAASNASETVIGNKKILISTYFASHAGIPIYNGMIDKFYNSTKGFSITTKEPTVENLKELNQYGAVFLSIPHAYSPSNGGLYLKLEETYVKGKYFEDRAAGRVGIFNVLSPGSAQGWDEANGDILAAYSYDMELRYVVRAQKFFPHYYNADNPFPNSFVHLGFHHSLDAKYQLSNTFLDAGAGCVSGYDQGIVQPHDFQVMDTMAGVFLGDGGRTVGDARKALLDAGLESKELTISFFKNLQWEVENRKVETIHHEMGNSGLMLWDEEPLPPGELTKYAEELIKKMHEERSGSPLDALLPPNREPIRRVFNDESIRGISSLYRNGSINPSVPYVFAPQSENFVPDFSINLIDENGDGYVKKTPVTAVAVTSRYASVGGGVTEGRWVFYLTPNKELMNFGVSWFSR